MEQFNLDTWLQDKSRKVVTRRGNPVRIICTDRKHGEDDLPIVFLEESPDGIGEFLLSCKADGTCDNYDTPYDLFFADEEELMEFEKALSEIIGFWQRDNGSVLKTQNQLKSDAKALLDLARKEILEEFRSREELFYKNGFEKGREDALKDLPKWKKAKKDEELDCHVAIQQDDRVVLSDFIQKDEYYITLDVLKILPKEE